MNSVFCFHGSFHLVYMFIVNPLLVWFVALAGQYSLLCSGKAFSIAQYLPLPRVSCPTREKYFLKPRYFRQLSLDVMVLRFVVIVTLSCAFNFQVKSSISAVFFCLWSVGIQIASSTISVSSSVFQWRVSDVFLPQLHSSNKGGLPSFLSYFFTALNYLLI